MEDRRFSVIGGICLTGSVQRKGGVFVRPATSSDWERVSRADVFLRIGTYLSDRQRSADGAYLLGRLRSARVYLVWTATFSGACSAVRDPLYAAAAADNGAADRVNTRCGPAVA